LTHFVRHTAAAVLVGAAALFATVAPQPASAQDKGQENEVVKATYGDWELVCSAAKADECLIRQVGKTADGNKIMVMAVRKLDGVKTKDGKPVPGAIQITTPLGTILRPGVQVKIDANEPRTGLFEICVPAGCVVRDAMSEEFLANLKAGKVAKVTFGVLRQGEVNVDISLKGFTKAFGSL